MTQDRPTAAELVTAVREFLERDVMTVTEGRVQFHTRVAINALGMVERELVDGPALAEAERDRAEALLGHSGDAAHWNASSRRAFVTVRSTSGPTPYGRTCAPQSAKSSFSPIPAIWASAKRLRE